MIKVGARSCRLKGLKNLDFFLRYILFIHLFIIFGCTESSCCMRDFSNFGGQAYCGDFPCCGAQALGQRGSALVGLWV